MSGHVCSSHLLPGECIHESHAAAAPCEGNAWAELCWFVSCPGCDHVHDLGEGASWNQGEGYSCEGCGLDFALPEQPNPNDLGRHCARGER